MLPPLPLLHQLSLHLLVLTDVLGVLGLSFLSEPFYKGLLHHQHLVVHFPLPFQDILLHYTPASQFCFMELFALHPQLFVLAFEVGHSELQFFYLFVVVLSDLVYLIRHSARLPCSQLYLLLVIVLFGLGRLVDFL